MADIKSQTAALEARLADKKSLLDDLSKLITYLEDSEKVVLDLIIYLRTGRVPPLPSEGGVEFGLILYWLDNPPAEIEKILSEHPLLKLLWDGLKEIAPKTKITKADYDFLINKVVDEGGVPAQDGTLYGFSQYEQLDYRWVFAALNYGLNLTVNELHPFGTNPYRGALKANSDGQVKIAILGDWGTGKWPDGDTDGPAVQIMTEARAKNPDYIFHLGDVYYAGTDWRPPPGEEQMNFIDLWGPSAPETSFTLNSNHEMYGAASGYFSVALAAGGPFAHQNQTSYFALTFGNWVIIGLDSAYYCDTLMYMEGGLGGAAHPEQANFIKGLDLDGKRIMVLTHHNGLNFAGSQVLDLWKELHMALDHRDPDYWYWGHIHDGIVYNGHSASGTHSHARCVGHSAIPYGEAWGLENSHRVDYYAHTRRSPGSKTDPRVLNGYAIIRLTENDIFEEFYEQGNPNPVWPGQG
ncbi:MAG: metallophosphoesterase [Sphingomonadales bacterium]|nr:metallophosphoesterase [Sphingomonadales bacterium]